MNGRSVSQKRRQIFRDGSRHIPRSSTPRRQGIGRLSCDTHYSARARSARIPAPKIATNKSCGSAKSHRRMEGHAHVPFPSSVTEGMPEGRQRRIPQMSTARERDGGRMQSGSVKGLILRLGWLSLTTRPDGTISRRVTHACPSPSIFFDSPSLLV